MMKFQFEKVYSSFSGAYLLKSSLYRAFLQWFIKLREKDFIGGLVLSSVYCSKKSYQVEKTLFPLRARGRMGFENLKGQKP